MEYLHPNFNVLEYDEQQGLFRKVSGVEDMCITNKKKTLRNVVYITVT